MDKSYDAKAHEDAIYAHWEKSGFFNPDRLDLPAEAKPYTIVLPPPNVTGTLHAGHAGVLAFEDILIRYHRMNGYRALWVPGTDHAAIATQTKVEKIIKDEGETRHSLGREKFLERVNAFAQDSHDTIISQCKKMGASLDWSREAFTLDEIRNKAVNSVFKLMYDDGLIYRGERVVNWCPRCHSTLADDEVEHKSNPAKLYFFRYSPDFPLTIATTRPETKLGDTAVAVNPKDERYKHLIGQVFEVDFVGVPLKLKIIADRNVDMDFGAGALGVTPAHAAIDWQMAEENELPIIKVINEDGIIREGFGDYSGATTAEAREMIVERLRNTGLLEKEEEIENNLSLCYRCSTAIEPLPSLQWFIDMNKPCERLGNKSIRQVCLAAVEEGIFGHDPIRIVPERFEKIYTNWLTNLRDWCISRQIWYGHRVPVWYQKDSEGKTTETFVGISAPEGEGWIQDEDTLDTWFSSGMWTFSTLARSPEDIRVENGRLVVDTEDFRRFHPTNVLETAYDIIFFWVARMIIMTTYAINDIPFQDVYLQGLVLDEHGKKMSKSKGNTINPVDMIERYGADATRLSLVVGSTPGNDMRLSEEKIAGFRNLVNKYWNIARYILQETEGLDTSAPIDMSKLTVADTWILDKLGSLSRRIAANLDDYRFSEAGEDLRDFTWNILADWYVEASKFQKGEETKKVLRHVLDNITKLWHPFIPFVTEAVWKESHTSDLIVEQWSQALSVKTDNTLSFELIKEIVYLIRNARSENQVEPGRKLKALVFAPKQVDFLKENEVLIKSMRTGIETLEISAGGEKPEKAIFIATGDIEIYLLGAVDPEKEKTRLQAAIANLDKLITLTETKLSNPEFVDRAPAAIVDKQKEQLANYKNEKDKLVEKLNEL
jgi:valyl-tRNA synthetase